MAFYHQEKVSMSCLKKRNINVLSPVLRAFGKYKRVLTIRHQTAQPETATLDIRISVPSHGCLTTFFPGHKQWWFLLWDA